MVLVLMYPVVEVMLLKVYFSLTLARTRTQGVILECRQKRVVRKAEN